jgi:cellulose synthase (UDP-forming)
MRLPTRPPLQVVPSQRLRVLPKPQTKTIVPKGIWALFVVSLLVFAVSFYITSWTTTGPTLLPPESTTPAAFDWLKPSSWNLLPPSLPRGTRLIPEFLQLPQSPWQQLEPLGLAVIFCLSLRLLPSNNWTRLVVKLIVVGLATRYMVWRILANTLNFATLLSTGLSVWILLVEVWSYVGTVLSQLQSIWSTSRLRTQQANQYEQDIRSGRYLPTVDVIIATYNEQPHMLRRTIAGCMAMDYPGTFKVYITDDGRRPQVRALAQEMGCGYITQPDGFINRHAKAGNMNNALSCTQGELIVGVDADFVPFKNFLMRTVGFFQDPEICLIQTPQDFYNPDFHVRNLGIDYSMPNDLQMFFRHNQPLLDAGNAVICCGTSYVTRRHVLQEIGGYFDRCLGEDSPTSMKMLTHGYRVVYLNEKLSMGESPRNCHELVSQRIRWLQSNIQIFYNAKEIPVFTKLNLIQRSFFLTMLMGAYSPLVKASLLLSPLLCLILGVSNYISTTGEFLYYCAPYLLLVLGTMGWASNYNISFIYQEMYDTLLCFPGVKRIFQIWTGGVYGKYGSAVTVKGSLATQKRYNLHITWYLLVLTLVSVGLMLLYTVGQNMGIWALAASEEYGLLFFWMTYNCLIFILTLIAAIDQPERRSLDRFPARVTGKLTLSDQASVWGFSCDLSEGGACMEFITDTMLVPGMRGELEFLEQGFSVPVQILRVETSDQSLRVSLAFHDLETSHYCDLADMLYMNMAWWKRTRRLGTLDSVFVMVGSVLKLRPIMSAYR